MNKNIVFIHGMFQNAKSWDNWVAYFSERGYRCVAPSWPDHAGEPVQLRANPPATLGDLSLDDVIAAMEQEVLAADRPIVIGHSVGGLLAQIFVNRNLVSRAVAISPVAPNKMMTLDWSFFKNVTAIANPLEGNSYFEQTSEKFHAEFCNTLSETEALQAFGQTATHDSRKVLRDCLGSSGHIDLDTPHVPIAFISGTEDRIIPHELVEKNSEAYKDAASQRAYRAFEGRSHFICGEPGWEEVAEYVYNWLQLQPTSVPA
ncbi:alpha/beta hydrolase [Rhabdobacter roseus]|uniref:Pimeloyl-ACP methyl ester carboxylesterase n=1 Tax=Rhabdobacter roseus TaxID=1655419 RepID=A0A840TPY7_9BACT|nr:alpha/beta hydrolase [Rhabdobacter roseus]MBB5286406.1 pimeloyl-ACP methyl ester carboxylesterase [Rhabdobacter roseus]